MHTIAEAMEEIERRLGRIEGLRTFDHRPSSVNPPAAWVQLPDIDYNLTFQDGSHGLMVPIVVVVSKVTDRALKTQLSTYLDPTGDRSIRAAVDGPFGNGYFLVQRARSGVLGLDGDDGARIARVEYWASTLDVQVVLA